MNSIMNSIMQPNLSLRSSRVNETETPLFQVDPVRRKAVMTSFINHLGQKLSHEEFFQIDKYFSLRPEPVNFVNETFIKNARERCDADRPPFLLIVCISSPEHVLQRNAIRNTWGRWKRSEMKEVKLIFLVGKSELPLDKELEHEVKTYGDLVQTSLQDSYRNLTHKVIMALKWAVTFCNGVKFFMKVDDDCFIHVPNAIKRFGEIEVPNHGIIAGDVSPKHVIQRDSKNKWYVTKQEYPFAKMPLYAEGQTYVISGNILDRLIYAAERIPFIPIEDGFITGVVRTVIGASICAMSGFPRNYMKPPGICSFLVDKRISSTNVTPKRMLELWKGLEFGTNVKCKKRS